MVISRIEQSKIRTISRYISKVADGTRVTKDTMFGLLFCYLEDDESNGAWIV